MAKKSSSTSAGDAAAARLAAFTALVAAKMSAGLSQSQAEEVANRQLDEDAAAAPAAPDAPDAPPADTAAPDATA